MPILYPETLPISHKRHKYTPRTLKQVRKLQEANRWRVREEYAVNSIYLTQDQLRDYIRESLEKGCAKKNCVLESFKVLQMWGIWKILYTEYHIRYEAIIRGSPIAHGVVILILAICLTALIIFGVWLVITELIEPIFEAIPPEARGIIVSGAVIGLTLLLAGGGIYLATRWLKKRK